MSHTWTQSYPGTLETPPEYEYVSGDCEVSVEIEDTEYRATVRLTSDAGEPCVESIEEVSINGGEWTDARGLEPDIIRLIEEAAVEAAYES